MIITFGKWQGWDTDRLATTGSFGRNYLDWGATDLRSPKWRQEFKRTLEENSEMDRVAMAQAIREHYPELVPELDQAIDIEMSEWADYSEIKETRRKLTNFFERKLREMGVSEVGIKYLVGNHWQIEELVDRGKVKFANANAKEIIDLCGRYGEAIYNLEYS